MLVMQSWSSDKKAARAFLSKILTKILSEGFEPSTAAYQHTVLTTEQDYQYIFRFQ